MKITDVKLIYAKHYPVSYTHLPGHSAAGHDHIIPLLIVKLSHTFSFPCSHNRAL